MAQHFVLHEVTPAQLPVLRQAIFKLWDFRPNASTPVTLQELDEWAHAGEFAVAIRVANPADFDANADDVLHALMIAAKGAIDVVGTVRQVTVYRARHTMQMLQHLGCPSFLYDRTRRVQEGAVAQGYFHITTKSYQPATLGQRMPRLEPGKDVLTYTSTAFVAADVEGTGLRHRLSHGKLVRNMPTYCHAARLGYRIFLSTTLYDHRGNGLNFANSFLQLVAKLAHDVGVELGLGAAISFNVVHWAVQSCWHEDATVVVACIDPADGFDLDSSYLYTSPRASSGSRWSRESWSSLGSGPQPPRKWWNWPTRVVKAIFQERRRSMDRRHSHVDRSSRY